MAIFSTKIDPRLAVNGVLVDFRLAFVDHSESQGATPKESHELLRFIPELLNTVAFQDRLTGQWRYEYGDPIELPRVIGDHTFPLMGRLYRALKEARMRLTEKDIAKWLKKLFNPVQHQDILEEMAPIYHLQDGIGVFPERKTSQTNDTDIDWELIVPNLPNFFLEVKHRNFDLKQGLIEIINRLPETSQPSKPTHDTDRLFRKLENKFEPYKPRDRLQGAWISTSLKQNEAQMRASFNRIHDDRLHFALLVAPGAEDNAAYLLTRPGVPGQHILDIFNLRHKPEKVFD